jgi:hypothetical protein
MAKPQTPGMSILNDKSLPLLGVKNRKSVSRGIIKPDAAPVLNDKGMEKFARAPKENEILTLDEGVTRQMKVAIPPIYYWEDVEDGKSVMMTMAFRWNGQNWGLAYPIETENSVTISMQRKRLFHHVKETLDILVHHGTAVLDNRGSIDPRLVNDQEALRWRHDKFWGQKVAAFNKLVRIAPITKKRAIELRLLDDVSIAT